MSANLQIGAEIKVLATAKLAISTATTTNFDFGAVNDLKLTDLSALKSGERIVVVFRATAAAGTSNISFSVQDAPDSSGSIGTAATARTDALPAAVAGDTTAVIGITVQPGRPWIRLRATNSGTEAYTCSAIVLAIPSGL